MVEPQEEAEHLAKYFLTNQKLTFPIGIWKSPKALNEDEGMTITSSGPMYKAYQPVASFTVWVLDGTGKIRKIMPSLYRTQETQLARTLEFLEREQTVGTR